MNDIKRCARAEPFHHRRFHRVRRAGVAQFQRVVGKLAAGGKLCFAFHERKGDTLEARNRAAKGFPVFGIGPGFIHRCLRGAGALQCDQRAAVIEPRHHFGKALALAAEPVGGGHVHGVEKYRAAAGHMATDVVKARARDAG